MHFNLVFTMEYPDSRLGEVTLEPGHGNTMTRLLCQASVYCCSGCYGIPPPAPRIAQARPLVTAGEFIELRDCISTQARSKCPQASITPLYKQLVMQTVASPRRGSHRSISTCIRTVITGPRSAWVVFGKKLP